jgi:hypothetical protein
MLVAVAAGLSAYAAGLWEGGPADFDPAGAPLEALGLAWLARGGSRARALAFIDNLAAESAHTGRSPGRLLEQFRSADFSTGNTLVLDGWIVAEAEALLGAGTLLRRAGRE